MAWRAARFPLPQESSAPGPLVAGFAPAGAGHSHLAQRWRASLQANFRRLLLEHTLNPALVGSPEGPWPEAEQASRPQGTGGHGGRIWGAKWVLGKRMAYQVPGRALGEVGVRHSSASLGFGLAARQGSQVGLLAPLALQGRKRPGSKLLSSAGLPAPKEPERSQLPRWIQRCPSPRLCWQDLLDHAWMAPNPQPLSPGSKGSGGLEQRWSCSSHRVTHPSTTPLLHTCKGAWPHGKKGMGLVCPTAHRLRCTGTEISIWVL